MGLDRDHGSKDGYVFFGLGTALENERIDYSLPNYEDIGTKYVNLLLGCFL